MRQHVRQALVCSRRFPPFFIVHLHTKATVKIGHPKFGEIELQFDARALCLGANRPV